MNLKNKNVIIYMYCNPFKAQDGIPGNAILL